MTRKYNTKHERARSRYRSRLEKRGYSRTPVMETLEDLRKRQGNATNNTTEETRTTE